MSMEIARKEMEKARIADAVKKATLPSNSPDRKLERLHTALDAAEVPIKGRGKALVETTGYSQGMISRFLTGKDTLNERFIKTVCRKYGLNEEYIESGEGSIFSGLSITSKIYDNTLIQKIHDAIINSFFPALFEKTESELHRIYADILECDRLQLVKKNGESITIYEAAENSLVNK